MRTLRVVPLTLVIALVLAFSGAAGAAGRPVVSVGDYWETASDFTMDAGSMKTTSRSEVLAFEPYTYHGAAVDAVKTVTTVTQTTSYGEGEYSFALTSETTVTSWSRVSDGASLASNTVTKTSGMPGQGTQETSSETIYNEPCQTYEWPLAVGKSWSFTCAYTTTVDGKTIEGSHTTEWRVAREEKVTVPAGTFDAFVLENGTDTKITQWYAPAACGAVKSEFESADPDAQASAGQHKFELKSFKCAKSGETAPSTGGSTPPPSNPSTPPATDGTTPPPQVDVKEEEKAKTPAPAALAVVLAGLGAALLARRRA